MPVQYIRSIPSPETRFVPGLRCLPDSEAALVDAVKAGNLDAFEALIRRHQARILRLAQNITRNQEDAEEVAQDSFMRVFAHMDGFHGDSRFSTWLTRIAINESLMKIRRRRRYLHEVSLESAVEMGDAPLPLQIQDGRPTPEQSCSGREQREIVDKMLAEAKPECRNLLELHLKDELSCAEIARILGVSHSAAKARIYRARMALRKALHAHGHPRNCPSPLPGKTLESLTA